MKKLVPILFYCLATIVAIILIAGYVKLSSTQGELADRIAEHQLSLMSDQKQYAKCYNSVNYGVATINDVSLSYLTFDSSEEHINKLHQIENDFKIKVQLECSSKISEYEEKHNAYVSSVNEYEASGWINFLIGGGVIETDVSELSPANVRMRAGNPLTTLIFTKEDVENYFAQNI